MYDTRNKYFLNILGVYYISIILYIFIILD